MLVLSRSVDEVLVIGEGPQAVRVKVLKIRGRHVHVGIEAPADMEVRRGELEKPKSESVTHREPQGSVTTARTAARAKRRV